MLKRVESPVKELQAPWNTKGEFDCVLAALATGLAGMRSTTVLAGPIDSMLHCMVRVCDAHHHLRECLLTLLHASLLRPERRAASHVAKFCWIEW